MNNVSLNFTGLKGNYVFSQFHFHWGKFKVCLNMNEQKLCIQRKQLKRPPKSYGIDYLSTELLLGSTDDKGSEHTVGGKS